MNYINFKYDLDNLIYYYESSIVNFVLTKYYIISKINMNN